MSARSAGCKTKQGSPPLRAPNLRLQVGDAAPSQPRRDGRPDSRLRGSGVVWEHAAGVASDRTGRLAKMAVMSSALTDTDGTAERYEAFLKSYPTGRLTVAVGFASVRGLAWLARRTRERPVRLVIGNCQRQRFAKASDEDRRVATAFLDRWDVEVKNWYRKNPVAREAHLKVWMIETEGGPVALVGSANLTGAGLFHNWEAVVEARGADREWTVSEVGALWREAWPYTDRVREYVAG